MTKMLDLVFRNGRIVTPDGVFLGDLGVSGGKIVALGEVPQTGAIEVSAKGRWVMPGGIDPHAHIEQMSGMGQWNADTFETATQSAAMGGTTSVISFAAQARGESIADCLDAYAQRARRGAMIDYAFHITLTDTSVAGFDRDLAAAISSGHRSLKVFTTYDIRLDDAELLRIFDLARSHGALVCVHAENDAIIDRARAALLANGQITPRDHARARPPMAEIEAVSRICRFAELTGQPVMLFHISTAEAAEVIRAARSQGAPVWAETCPHYLFMTEDVLDKPGLEGAKWMCSPPQRTQKDQAALWQALNDRTLDLVSSDHAPYRFDATGKLAAGPTPTFAQIANGLPGLETRLPLMFDALVGQEGTDRGAMQFAELTATAPARIYGLAGKGSIGLGQDADVVLWNPNHQVTYGPDDLHDNVGYNPWEGVTVQGWPTDVFLRGTALVRDGTFLGEPGQGRWMARPRLATPPLQGASGS